MNLRLRCMRCGCRYDVRLVTCPRCHSPKGPGRRGSAPWAALACATVFCGCVEPGQPKPADPAQEIQQGDCGGEFEDGPICAGGVYGAPFGPAAAPPPPAKAAPVDGGAPEGD
ncbi:MAG: hypothetical protein JRI68_14895 [Deltaproteobacteria bacterium]|nr:hypothetical protein [Deltaproteobacteria bacterium]